MNSATLSTLPVADVNRDREISGQYDSDIQRSDSVDEYTTVQDFSSVLDSARMIQVNTNRISGFNATSPSQMFEALSPNMHDHRQSVMQQQHRIDSLNGPGSRLDPTNVQDRLSNQPTIESNQKTLNQRLDFSDLKLNGQNASTPAVRQPQTDDIIKMNPAIEMKNPENDLFKHSGLRSQSQTSAGSNQSAEMMNMTGSTNKLAATSQIAATRSISSGKAQSSQIAQQIGQVLSSARAGEAESAKAVQPSSPSTDAKLQTSNRKTASETLTKSTQEMKSNEPLDKQSDSTSRTQFEQLVRSIRMRPGLWQSSAKMRLDPPSLGKINVDVRLVGKKLQIDIRTETIEAAERLLQQSIRLKSALEQQGIQIERFDVNVDDAQHQTDRKSDSQSSSSTTSQNRESSNTHWHENDLINTGESTDSFETEANDVELNAVAERRIDIKV